MMPDAGGAIATNGPVHVIGAGLLGTSIGLSLAARSVEVTLEDVSPTTVALAAQWGAGRQRTTADAEPELVVVAVPPDVAGLVVAQALARFPSAVVTDVASVKVPVLEQAQTAGAELSRYVGSHPMAGSERSGPAAARADLFAGRPWVIAAGKTSSRNAVLAVRHLAVDVGAYPVTMSPAEHDQAVALVSHVPQLVASLMAARLVDAPQGALDLAGQGLRDVTRIAASDPRLWVQILSANAPSVVEILRRYREDLDDVIGALSAAGGGIERSLVTIASAISTGNTGQQRIPGKHGSSQHDYDRVVVAIPDEPGQLGRLFADIGDASINIEDFTIEHAARQPVGMATVSVLPGVGPTLVAELAARGWTIVG